MQQTDYQGYDNLAVWIGFEFNTGANAGAERDVVIDFTIDGEYDFAINANQRLCARICNGDINYTSHIFKG